MSGSAVIPVKVAVRCRPLINNEVNDGCQMCVFFVPDEPQILLGNSKAFTYDYVFKPTDIQGDVFHLAVKPLIDNIFKGYNATVLAYGQTGSGKTYTMGGCYEASLQGDEKATGIIPRVLKDIFNEFNEKPEFSFDVKVSYIEIYNEEINDLLSSNKKNPLMIREDGAGGIKIQGVNELSVATYQETMNVLEKGSQSRSVGSTAMNNTSSRSHAIFSVIIERKEKGDNSEVADICKSKFHLVDLAGSERLKRTHAEGERFKEGVNINLGLLSLGNVISALGEDTKGKTFVPYRDSKLTRILQDSLGGNSHTLMIACISPADYNMEETLNTLRYADRARKIKNKPIVNRDPKTAEIIRLKELVQHLQLQLMNGGVAVGESVSTVSSIVTSSSGTNTSCIDHGNTEALKELQDKNKELEDENARLTRELSRAIDQSTNMCEKVIRLEMKCERLKKRLQDLKKDTGIDLEILGTSIDVESNPVVKEQLEKLKNIAVQMNQDSSEEEKDEEIQATDVSDDENDDEENINLENKEDQFRLKTPDTPDSRAKSKEYTLRQADMNRELQKLNNLLAKKEQLASHMCMSEEKMEALRKEYETTRKDMESEINNLQQEKEDLQAALTSARVNANASKVSEQRRQRLKELETQISALRKKMNEQTKLIKLKENSDKQVAKLNLDIQGLKQNRVKLMKQIKEEADSFRKWKQQKDKEVLQLKEKDRKRQCELAKLQRENQKQRTVLKRKAEEAAAANKRLKDVHARQKQVLAERSQKLEKYDATSIGNRVRSWLSQELEIQVSIREAKYHLDGLLSDRKTLNEQLRELKVKLGEEPPKKKFAWENSQDYRAETSLEEEQVKKEIEALEREIELRNIQIADLQQKIVDADQDCKGNAAWESLHTMIEAKCGLKWLLEQAVSTRVDANRIDQDLKNTKDNHADNSHEIRRLEIALKEKEKKYEAQVTALQKQHEEKVLFLLRQMKSTDSGKMVNGGEVNSDLWERMKIQQEEIDKLSTLHEDLQKKNEECEQLQKQLTRFMYQSKKLALLPDLENPAASPFLSPEPKKKRTAKLKAKPVYKDDSDEDEEDGESPGKSDENDPDWAKNHTPGAWLKRNVARTRRRKTFGRGKTSSDSQDSQTTLNSTYNLAEDPLLNDTEKGSKDNSPTEDNPAEKKTKKRKSKKAADEDSGKSILKKLMDNKDIRSSDEFEIPKVRGKKSEISRSSGIEPDIDSSTSTVGGLKKKRRLGNKSTSFFSPVE